MAVYLVRTEFQPTSGLAKDIVTSNLHFETIQGNPTEAVGLALIGHVAAAYEAQDGNGNSLSKFLSGELSRAVKPVGKAYEGDGVGLMGSPIATASWAGFSNPVAASALPSEVACCLSFRKDYGVVPEEAPDGADAGNAPDRPRSRQRGRMYFGPLVGGNNVNTAAAPTRPNAVLISTLNAFGLFLANPTNATLTGVQAHWGILGKNGFSEVDTCWVDDAFDTQRRRGVARTGRTFQVV